MFAYAAQVIRDDRFGSVLLRLLRDGEPPEPDDGDEILIANFAVNGFAEPPEDRKDS